MIESERLLLRTKAGNESVYSNSTIMQLNNHFLFSNHSQWRSQRGGFGGSSPPFAMQTNNFFTGNSPAAIYAQRTQMHKIDVEVHSKYKISDCAQHLHESYKSGPV